MCLKRKKLPSCMKSTTRLTTESYKVCMRERGRDREKEKDRQSQEYYFTGRNCLEVKVPCLKRWVKDSRLIFTCSSALDWHWVLQIPKSLSSHREEQTQGTGWPETKRPYSLNSQASWSQALGLLAMFYILIFFYSQWEVTWAHEVSEEWKALFQ